VPRMSTWCGTLAGCLDIRLSERPPAHAGKCRHVMSVNMQGTPADWEKRMFLPCSHTLFSSN
jgi:hypothetical protein